jgi:beta-xylosidase
MTDPGTPPVYSGDFPDPCLIRVGDTYYAYATNAGGFNVQVMVSMNLTDWTHLGDALPTLPAWARPGYTWAPAVAQVSGRFVLYYTVREPASGRQCISVAAATAPEGPFVDERDGPLVLQRDHGGSIDPTPFTDVDGSRYLVWKSDDNAIGGESSLWGQPLDATALTLVGSPTRLLGRDRNWERPLVEAPALVVDDRTYYLFYSGNWWESDNYAIGYATAPAPLGPYTKATLDEPWFGSGPSVSGPGGQDFCPGDEGRLWMAYHGWRPGHVGYAGGGARSLYIASIGLGYGAPVVNP